jgi:hypothetical protein
MNSGSPVGSVAAHDTPEVLRLDGHRLRLRRSLRNFCRLWREHRSNQVPLPKGALWLWAVVISDIVMAALMTVAGGWFDQTSTLTSLVTLGAGHRLVLIMAVAGVATLACLAPLTTAFSRATYLEKVLLSLACVFSVTAAAGALITILLLALACVLAVTVLLALITLLIVVVR